MDSYTYHVLSDRLLKLESPVMELGKAMTKHTDTVFFSLAQLQYLESLFPALVLGPSTPEAALRHHFGTQDVLSAIRRKTRGLNGRTETADIPSPQG